jgi:hypothetical protein
MQSLSCRVPGTANYVDCTSDHREAVLEALETIRGQDLAAGNSAGVPVVQWLIQQLSHQTVPIRSISELKDMKPIDTTLYNRILALTMRKEQKGKTAVDRSASKGELKASRLLSWITRMECEQELKNAGTGTPAVPAASWLPRQGQAALAVPAADIPRSEMIRHNDILLKAPSPFLQGCLVGSYRRGAPNSRSVNILIQYDKQLSSVEGHFAFESLLRHFWTIGYLSDALATAPDKWTGFGIVCLHRRRINIYLTSTIDFPYAFLKLTGPEDFYAAIQKYCQLIGYTLTQNSLIQIAPKAKPVPVVMNSEQDIFSFIGLEYVHPGERSFFIKVHTRTNT